MKKSLLILAAALILFIPPSIQAAAKHWMLGSFVVSQTIDGIRDGYLWSNKSPKMLISKDSYHTWVAAQRSAELITLAAASQWHPRKRDIPHIIGAVLVADFCRSVAISMVQFREPLRNGSRTYELQLGTNGIGITIGKPGKTVKLFQGILGTVLLLW